MAKIKKNELRDIVKSYYEERTGETIAYKDLEPIIEDVILSLEDAILQGYDVQLGNIGTIKHKIRKARKGVNPKLLKELKEQGVSAEEAKKQAEIDIPEAKALGFTPSKYIKKELNK